MHASAVNHELQRRDLIPWLPVRATGFACIPSGDNTQSTSSPSPSSPLPLPSSSFTQIVPAPGAVECVSRVMVSASAAFIAFAYPGPHQLCATAHGRPLCHSPQWLTPPFCTSPLHSHFQPFYHHIGNCIKVSPKGRIICRRQVAEAFTAANCRPFETSYPTKR